MVSFLTAVNYCFFLKQMVIKVKHRFTGKVCKVRPKSLVLQY